VCIECYICKYWKWDNCKTERCLRKFMWIIFKNSVSTAVRTHDIHYKGQPVNDVQGSNDCLFWESHKPCEYSVGKHTKFYTVKGGGSCHNHCVLKAYIHCHSVKVFDLYS
jgi:hypothetical protein